MLLSPPLRSREEQPYFMTITPRPLIRVHPFQRRSRLMTRITCPRDLIVHLEPQMDPVTLKVMPFALVDERLNGLALSRVSRTLVDIAVIRGVVSRWGQKRCLRPLSDPG